MLSTGTRSVVNSAEEAERRTARGVGSVSREDEEKRSGGIKFKIGNRCHEGGMNGASPLFGLV
jgi:hypothetical protein